MTDSTQEREARNYIKEVIADLETELEMYEQALTRANAVIERVVALLAACDDDTERTPEYGWVLRCDANFVDQLRTILEGNGA